MISDPGVGEAAVSSAARSLGELERPGPETSASGIYREGTPGADALSEADLLDVLAADGWFEGVPPEDWFTRPHGVPS